MWWIIAYLIFCYVGAILFWWYHVSISIALSNPLSDADTMLIGGSLILAPLVPVFCTISLTMFSILHCLQFIWEICKNIMYYVGDAFQGIVILIYLKNH